MGQTDGRIAVSLNAPLPQGGGIISKNPPKIQLFVALMSEEEHFHACAKFADSMFTCCYVYVPLCVQYAVSRE